jgi:serine/threonine protein kinase
VQPSSVQKTGLSHIHRRGNSHGVIQIAFAILEVSSDRWIIYCQSRGSSGHFRSACEPRKNEHRRHFSGLGLGRSAQDWQIEWVQEVDTVAILNTVAQFGRYMLRSRLATANACEVWLAEIDGAAQGAAPVVFKKLRPELAQNPSLAESFTERGRRASYLDHDCVVRVLETVVDRNDRGLAMEYVDGKTLRQLITTVGGVGNALPVWFAIHVARRICQALEHAHESVDAKGLPQHVLHENLRPENVFLTFLGQVKVTDFGLSHAALSAAGGTTSHASMLAPAGPNRQARQTESGDVFGHDLEGVGRVLYELLTGICPGSTNDANVAFLPPSQYAPWVNAEVDELLSRILWAGNSRRFQSALEIRRALDEYLSAHRHDVAASHIAGLVSVLFSAECRDSSPPTMRFKEGAMEMAMRRARRTTPPDVVSHEHRTDTESVQASLSAPPSSRLSRPTVPSPPTNGSMRYQRPVAIAPDLASTPQPGEQNRPSEPRFDSSSDTGNRDGPFHHDWDLALKRAREQTQANQRVSGKYPTAAAIEHAAPPIDPLERAVAEFERGLEHMRHGGLEEAMKAWERALEFDPQHRVCRANLNLLKKKLGSVT